MRFDSLHPAINVLFFAAVIVFAATWNHPVLIGVSYLAACAYSVALGGRRACRENLAFVVCALVWGAWFAATTHFGVTNVGRTPIGNSITLESLACGCAQGFMLATVLMWISCVLRVLTADKVIFVLGRICPKLAMFAAIALRGAPAIAHHARCVNEGRCGIGRGACHGNALRRVRNALRCGSIVLSWSIERAVDASASMRSRGSGLPGRTAFGLYRLSNRDRACAVWLVALITACGVGSALGQTSILYAPRIALGPATPLGAFTCAAYALLCLWPFVMHMVANWRLKRALQSCDWKSLLNSLTNGET